jgi:hypothetical protein
LVKWRWASPWVRHCSLGLDLGIISPALFSMLVVMALVTTFMTTPLLMRLYPEAALRAPRVPAPTPAFEG